MYSRYQARPPALLNVIENSLIPSRDRNGEHPATSPPVARSRAAKLTLRTCDSASKVVEQKPRFSLKSRQIFLPCSQRSCLK
jgi:hypothetical protein